MSIDVIGIIYNNDAVIDDDGNTITPPTVAEGYHINTTQKLVGLDAYIVTPTTPRRVFAGVKTICYTFADETEAKDLIGYDDETGYTPTFEPVVPVPESVTKRQGRQQMILMGIIDAVQPAIDAITDPVERALVQSFWDDSTHYERHHPQMIALAGAVGLSDEDLDQAFIEASKL